jgi:hypothetical protein
MKCDGVKAQCVDYADVSCFSTVGMTAASATATADSSGTPPCALCAFPPPLPPAAAATSFRMLSAHKPR